MKKGGLKGFTLIEIIVVIAIIGALAAIIVPSLIGYTRQAKAAVAGISLVSKRPEQMGKSIIFAAMVETYAILALLISILSIFGIAGLGL